MKLRLALAFAAVAIVAAAAGIYVSYWQTSATPFGRAAKPKPIPELRFVDGAGRALSLADFRGKVVLLNIWATWCPPCKIEMPSMERLHQKLAGTDFQLVAVSVDEEDSSVVNKFVKEYGLTFPVLHNQDGSIRQIYQTTGVPESFVIDRDGVIVKKVIGAADWDAPVNENLIRRLLDAR